LQTGPGKYVALGKEAMLVLERIAAFIRGIGFALLCNFWIAAVDKERPAARFCPANVMQGTHHFP
jgi:hypothetical protein